MEYTILDSFQLTVVAMLLVFVVLIGLMLLMMLTGELVQRTTRIEAAVPVKSTATPVVDEEYSKVAILAALAEAAEVEITKHYQIEKIERIS